jgi:hypothetical protein
MLHAGSIRSEHVLAAELPDQRRRAGLRGYVGKPVGELLAGRADRAGAGRVAARGMAGCEWRAVATGPSVAE